MEQEGDGMSILKRLMCRHAYNIDRWHFTHGQFGNEPAYIEGFKKCAFCGKEKYFTVERGSNVESYIMEHMKERQR